MARFTAIMRDTDNILKEVDSYLKVHEGTVMPETSFNRFTQKLAGLIGCSDSTMEISCLSVQKTPITKEALYALLWRLCANKDRIKAGYPVLCYPYFSFSGVEEVRFESIVRKGTKFKTGIRVLTGHYAYGTFSCNFSERGIGMILSQCGYSGRTYVVGRKEQCLKGLFALTELTSKKEDSRIFKEVVPNDSMVAFNRKNVIAPRIRKVTCPFKHTCPCLQCDESPKVCLASYKEFKYYD